MLNIILFLLTTERKNKRILTIMYDVVAIVASLYLAVAVRLGSWHFPVGISEIASVLVTLTITIAVFIRCGMYRAVLRYMMLPAMGYVFLSVFLSAISLAISSFFFQSFVPRSVPFIYAGIATLALGSPRVLLRTFYYHYYKRQKPNIFIYGAGATGRELVYALIQGDEYHPVAILDDDKEKIGQIICGIKVYKSEEFEKLKRLYQPVKLLLAINNIKKGQRLRLLEKLSHWPIEVQSVPSVEDIAIGRATATEIRDLEIADLLGREAIEPDKELMEKNIFNKSVMVTGAGGSIGSELCRQILVHHPRILLLFELNEYNLYSIDQELQSIKQRLQLNTQIIAALGSVQRKNRVQKLIRANKVETIYHAAAYKHVPLVEENIIEGIRNNVFGTLACAEAAIEEKVENFTLISTDKAVRPTNVMGTSKRLAELLLQALAEKQNETIFTMVRFGNVLGSSGSVVPLFKKQIREGGPVTVTHPEIIRYFMLIPEAAQLVIQAAAIGKTGQVFVLDMGDPIKILDLARRMINLMGMKSYIEGQNEEGDIAIKFSGLRPGEKLYEELLIGDNVEGTRHAKIMTAKEEKLSWSEMEKLLIKLDNSCHDFDIITIRTILQEAPTGYSPAGANKAYSVDNFI